MLAIKRKGKSHRYRDRDVEMFYNSEEDLTNICKCTGRKGERIKTQKEVNSEQEKGWANIIMHE